MLLKVSVNSVDILCYLQNNMMYAQIIRLLGGFNCFLFCYKSSGLCILYHFLLKKCEAANQNCTYKLSWGINISQAITGKKGSHILVPYSYLLYLYLFRGLWYLTPLSTIFQLYRGGQKKPEFPEKRTNLPQ